MKKRLLSGMLVIALAGAAVMSGGTVVKAAASNTYTDSGMVENKTATQDKVTDPAAEDGPNVIGIDVQAQTTGGGDILYSVQVDWGDMRFEYDYGSTWDPETHTYKRGSTQIPEGGWNTSKYVDGTNNKITVTNDSNFPVVVDFAYENTDPNTFNATETTTSVKGFFAETNQGLLDQFALPSLDTSILPAAPTMVLNTTTSALTVGDIYYYKDTDNGINKKDVYFSLIGIPDRGIELSTMKSVGTIKVKITPATGVKTVTK